jgi:hypothetical protein
MTLRQEKTGKSENVGTAGKNDYVTELEHGKADNYVGEG